VSVCYAIVRVILASHKAIRRCVRQQASGNSHQAIRSGCKYRTIVLAIIQKQVIRPGVWWFPPYWWCQQKGLRYLYGRLVVPIEGDPPSGHHSLIHRFIHQAITRLSVPVFGNSHQTIRPGIRQQPSSDPPKPSSRSGPSGHQAIRQQPSGDPPRPSGYQANSSSSDPPRLQTQDKEVIRFFVLAIALYSSAGIEYRSGSGGSH